MEEGQEEVSEMAVYAGEPMEEMEAEPDVTSYHRSRWGSLRNRAQEAVGMVKENPTMATIFAVTVVSIGWSLMRRRR